MLFSSAPINWMFPSLSPLKAQQHTFERKSSSGHSASLMRGSSTVFRYYIRIYYSLQTKCCRVHLEAAWGNHCYAPFDWHVLTSPNEPELNERKKNAGYSDILSHHYSFLLFFPHPLPLDQCPLCHQEMCKLRLSTPPQSVLPGVPQALSLSMESTRDTRWVAPFCQLVHSSGRR